MTNYGLRQSHRKIIGKTKKSAFCVPYSVGMRLRETFILPWKYLKWRTSRGWMPLISALATDDRLYQMNHCVSIPMNFVSAIFARLSRQMTRATLTAKMALTAKMRDCSRFMAWITLLSKWRPTRASGIIYHLLRSALDHRQDTYISETALHTSQRYLKCSKLYINAINTSLQMMHYK
jgi:hypothetical protein